ncbi:MAG: hypothetical protein ACREJG_01470 [Candidatus Rokuibacteriota bacterium]
MSGRVLLGAALLTLAAAPALADHPGALRSAPMSPLVTALLWGGLAFLVGMVVVIIVTVIARKPE